jgi:hypothetical protein
MTFTSFTFLTWIVISLVIKFEPIILKGLVIRSAIKGAIRGVKDRGIEDRRIRSAIALFRARVAFALVDLTIIVIALVVTLIVTLTATLVIVLRFQGSILVDFRL